MPSLKSILVSPSKKRKDKAREERKRSISGPLEIGVSREEAVGLVSPRDAPSTPNSSPGLPPISTARNDGSPTLGVARLHRVTTAPGLTGSPRPRHGKEVKRESGERQLGAYHEPLRVYKDELTHMDQYTLRRREKDVRSHNHGWELQNWTATASLEKSCDGRLLLN